MKEASAMRMIVAHPFPIVSTSILERARMHTDDVIIDEPPPAKKLKENDKSVTVYFGQRVSDKTLERYSVVYVPQKTQTETPKMGS